MTIAALSWMATLLPTSCTQKEARHIMKINHTFNQTYCKYVCALQPAALVGLPGAYVTCQFGMYAGCLSVCFRRVHLLEHRPEMPAFHP